MDLELAKYKNQGDRQKAEARMLRSKIDKMKVIHSINKFLPREICAYTYKNVSKSVNIRKICRKRVYEYYMPLFMYKKKDIEKEVDKTVTPEEEAAIMQRV